MTPRPPRPGRVPLMVLATTDPVVRDAATFAMATDDPSLVVLRHDILEDEQGGAIRRVVLDATGVVEDCVVPLEHACLSCAVREDALPVLRALASHGRWGAVMLALPVSAESLPVTRALGWETGRSGLLRDLRLAHVLAAVDVDTFEDDVLGDDLLDERGLALTSDDRRSVGEAVVAQVAHADTVLVTGDADAHGVASDLLDHLRAVDGHRVDGLYEHPPTRFLTGAHDARCAERRLDPLHAERRRGAVRTDGDVWTIELRSERPLHPDRLVEHVRRLGEGRLRSRGRFWVPSRPGSVCAWDGAGGQLSIGVSGEWGRREPDTCLVVTGVGAGQAEVRRAFDDILMTEHELRDGLTSWLGRPDVLEPWLG
ncbi:GTP-binding protein [Cellulomonas sp. HZM]|uniref:CobW family GTP-binding protein n=1 Tax=Cellulomonas sp. HZM TaxID=1454010 RepID=UPI0004934CDA|nr:GTP-binding protein [Cellulomonas sp. HZM]